MFDSIKNKFQTVQRDISTSFTKFTVKESELPDKDIFQSGNSSFNYDTGAELLTKYQGEWAEIHSHNEENASSAKAVNQVMENMCSQWEHQNKALTDLNSEVSSIPQAVTDIANLTAQLGELQGIFEEVESCLVVLEDVIEQLEVQDLQLNHRLQLASYREKKLADLEALQSSLARQHACTVREFEQKESKLKKDRADEADKKFHKELEMYKQGALPSVNRGHGFTSASSIDEVTLDEDPSDLDRFLEEETTGIHFNKAKLSVQEQTAKQSQIILEDVTG